MDDIADAAGLTKRTLYNNYAGKEALFREVLAEVMAFAEEFAQGLDPEFFDEVAADPSKLQVLAKRLAQSILRPPVIALRRLLISESPAFPDLAEQYFNRAPGAVLKALAAGFAGLRGKGAWSIDDARLAAEHFAYLVVGAQLDKAMMVGTIPTRNEIAASATGGARAFLSAYAAPRRKGAQP